MSVVIKMHGLYKLNWELSTWILQLYCVLNLMLSISNLSCNDYVVNTRRHTIEILGLQGILCCGLIESITDVCLGI